MDFMFSLYNRQMLNPHWTSTVHHSVLTTHVIAAVRRNLPTVPLCVPAVPAADPPGDGGHPEEAGRVLRGPEAVPEERVGSERLFPVSPPADPLSFTPAPKPRHR